MKRPILLPVLCLFAIALAMHWPAIFAFLFRELIFKQGVRTSGYMQRTDVPDQCPSFASVADYKSLRDFDYGKYSGVWYGFMVSDPTQPPDSCHCERFQWNMRNGIENAAFDIKYDAYCQIYKGSSLYPFAIDLEGRTNPVNATHRAMSLEGAPKLGR